MKRIGILFGLAAIGLLASCGNEANTTTEKKDETTTVVPTTSETTTVVPTTTVDETPVSIICPSGTPALGLANYYDSVKGASFEIVNGADQLVAAFGTKSHDLIVAPVNLGAKFYNTNENYVLAKTFVWGNLFLASKAELTSFEDINNKKLVVFGKNSTPDILTKILIQEKNLNVEIEYVDDVATANSLLVAGTAEYTITAEPAISKIKDAKGINVIDLQDEYKKVTGKDSYPQAGIFIKKEAKEDSKVLNAVDALVNSVKDAVENPANTAKKAVAMHKSFETVGEAALTKAIPNCHFIIMDHDKEVAAVNEYLQYMIDLGFGKQAGDKLPNEEFFL